VSTDLNLLLLCQFTGCFVKSFHILLHSVLFFPAVERVLKFQAPGIWSFYLRLQNNLVQKIRKNIVFLFNSLVPQIISMEPEPKFQARLQPSKIAWVPAPQPWLFTLISKISSSLTSWRFLGVFVFSQMCKVSTSCSTCSL